MIWQKSFVISSESAQKHAYFILYNFWINLFLFPFIRHKTVNNNFLNSVNVLIWIHLATQRVCWNWKELLNSILTSQSFEVFFGLSIITSPNLCYKILSIADVTKAYLLTHCLIVNLYAIFEGCALKSGQFNFQGLLIYYVVTPDFIKCWIFLRFLVLFHMFVPVTGPYLHWDFLRRKTWEQRIVKDRWYKRWLHFCQSFVWHSLSSWKVICDSVIDSNRKQRFEE